MDRARELFGARGFDRTTIRAVAAAAAVDPALVMQYFGSKRELFSQAVRVSAPPPEAAGAAGPAEQLLATLGLKLGGLPDGTLAMLRSMLTEPAAAEHARTVLGEQIEGITAALTHGARDGAATDGAEDGSGDAELRAALALSTMVGVTVGHQLLGLAPLREADPDRVAELLRPALLALLTGDGGRDEDEDEDGEAR